MKKLLLGFALACAVAATAAAASTPASAPVASAPAGSMQEPAAASTPRAIPYKKEETAAGASVSRSFVILTVLLGLFWGGLWTIKRYFPNARVKLPLFPMQSDAQRRLKLIETMRLGPKATLYLVQLDHKTVLLAQSGDNITVADAGGVNNKDDDVAKPL